MQSSLPHIFFGSMTSLSASVGVPAVHSFVTLTTYTKPEAVPVVKPPAGVPCSCWYSPTQTKNLASGGGVSDLLMVRSGARLSSVQPTPPRYKIATLNNFLLAILTLLSITLCLCKTAGCRTGNLLCVRTHEREWSVTHHSSSAEIMAIVILLSESTFGENKAASAEPACLAFNTKTVAV